MAVFSIEEWLVMTGTAGLLGYQLDSTPLNSILDRIEDIEPCDGWEISAAEARSDASHRMSTDREEVTT